MASSKHGPPAKGGVKITQAITVRKPPAEVFAFWRDLQNAGEVMPGNVSVTTKSDRRSHWTARGPGGLKLEWDAEIVDEEPNRMIAWRSNPGADIDNSGQVSFEPIPNAEHSTKVKLALHYTPPGGTIGSLIGKATRERAVEEVAAGLKRIKSKLEGEA